MARGSGWECQVCLGRQAMLSSFSPLGSTDCICFATVGTNDPVTSALHIIIGDSQPMDVCSIWHNGKLLRYSVSLVGYGFYGDVVSASEKHRWMGPIKSKLDCKINFIEEWPRLSLFLLFLPAGGEWQQVQGRFLAVNLTCMSSACPKSPEGLSPCAHLADGTADLILVHECSVLSFLKHLTRHTNCSDQVWEAFLEQVPPPHSSHLSLLGAKRPL
uniref:Ceramide kinase C-terminal domain-containing protein n=1 Tax=Varanus komodoensis TaxID=61221 RepID=A0A8D2J3S6_VARKO